MASLGQIIFWSMIVLIFIFAAIIILILALTLSGPSSEVESSNRSTIANLGQDVRLSCFLLLPNEGGAQFSDVSITWRKEGLSGLVYQYQDGAANLRDQNPDFRGRTQLFTDAINKGNASLLLMRVRSSDDGVYSCSVSSSSGGGSVSIRLRTAAFSAPKFTNTKDILIAEAERWLPKPSVTWLDYDGKVLNASTTFNQNSAGIFSIVSTLQPVTRLDTYTCHIQNTMVLAISEATITGSGVSERTTFTFSAATSVPASNLLSIMTSVLCIYYLT
uniref:V-set domain-containing T-cell activation inhibitor 1 n=1 Tax=Centroberyx gerrardi TaxID=166262 RepID=UPI003AB0CD5C